MTHDEAYSELAAVAVDAVSAEVGRAVREHAEVCPECGPELAAMEEAVATLGHLVPSGTINRGRSAGIRSRLVMRARADRETKVASLSSQPDLARGVASLTGQGHRATPGSQRAVTGETKRITPAQPQHPVHRDEVRSGRFNWFAMAATLALIATGAQLFRVTTDRNQIRNQLAAADTLAPKADSLRAAVNEKEAMIAAMAGPDVKVVPLLTEGSPQTLGTMTWNRRSNDWIMVTYGLRAPKPGMTYQVWLVTDDAKISAGTFLPDKEGKTVMHAHYEMLPNALRAVAITEEPQGGVTAPTGPMVVVGSA